MLGSIGTPAFWSPEIVQGQFEDRDNGYRDLGLDLGLDIDASEEVVDRDRALAGGHRNASSGSAVVGSYSGYSADCWAVGCTLHCLLFGTTPFIPAITSQTPSDELSPLQLFDAIARDPPIFQKDSLSVDNPALMDILEGLLIKTPSERWDLYYISQTYYNA